MHSYITTILHKMQKLFFLIIPNLKKYNIVASPTRYMGKPRESAGEPIDQLTRAACPYTGQDSQQYELLNYMGITYLSRCN